MRLFEMQGQQMIYSTNLHVQYRVVLDLINVCNSGIIDMDNIAQGESIKEHILKVYLAVEVYADFYTY